MSTPAQKKARQDHYNRNHRDVSTDTTGGPPGSLGVICGCHYKINTDVSGRERAWRWNIIENDWVSTTNSVEWILRMFSTKQSKDSKVI